MDSGDLKRVLRRVFDTQVLNHGDYNLVYGQPSGTGPALVLGYRRQPLELVLCPVDVPSAASLPPDQTDLLLTAPAGPPASVALTNVATLADTGHGYQVETVTGYRTWFEVSPLPPSRSDRLGDTKRASSCWTRLTTPRTSTSSWGTSWTLWSRSTWSPPTDPTDSAAGTSGRVAGLGEQ